MCDLSLYYITPPPPPLTTVTMLFTQPGMKSCCLLREKAKYVQTEAWCVLDADLRFPVCRCVICDTDSYQLSFEETQQFTVNPAKYRRCWDKSPGRRRKVCELKAFKHFASIFLLLRFTYFLNKWPIPSLWNSPPLPVVTAFILFLTRYVFQSW